MTQDLNDYKSALIQVMAVRLILEITTLGFQRYYSYPS